MIATLCPYYGMHWGWDLQELDFAQTFASFGYLCPTQDSVDGWAHIESYNHIVGCVGKVLKGHLVPNHLQRAGMPQGPTHPSPEHFQEMDGAQP